MHFQMLRNFIIDLGAHIWIIFVKIWLANTESFYKRFVHGLWIGFGRLRGEEVSALFAPLGSISSTNLHTAFTPVAPQSIRTQSSCQYLFTLLGFTHIKLYVDVDEIEPWSLDTHIWCDRNVEPSIFKWPIFLLHKI